MVDFCLIGVIMRMLNEILLVIWFCCLEVFFCEFEKDELKMVVKIVVDKIEKNIFEEGLDFLISYMWNGWEVVNMI